MNSYCGFCKKCRKYFRAPESFDERRHILQCPECHSSCSLDRNSIENLQKTLHLAKSEIGLQDCYTVVYDRS